jgi:hypothetical protein
MQEIDIRYAFILLPLSYVLIPYFFTGNFILLGGISALAFILGAIIFALIANLHIQGNGSVLASGVGGSVGQNNEGGYQLFVLVFGGLFYLGSQVTQYIIPIINVFINAISFLLSFVGVNLGLNSSSLNGINNISILSSFYPLNFTIEGINIFVLADAGFGVMFMLGIYFMIASRGH